MTIDRDALLAKLRKLAAMTTAAGCTEAEAMRAAEIMRRLIDDHAIDPAEISADQYHEEPTDARRRRRNRLERLWSIVAWYCDCAVFVRADGAGRRAIYFGVEPRPTIARYLHDVCEDAAAWSVAEFRKSEFYRKRRTARTRNAAVAAFVDGFVDGLLVKLFDQKPDARNPSLVDAANAELHRVRKLSEARAITPIVRAQRFSQASVAGRLAGYKAEVNDGLAGSAAPVALIGRE